MKSLLIALSLFFVTPAFAQGIDEAPKVHARLVAEDLSVPPGGTITVALEENIYRSRILVAKRESNGSHGDIRFDLPRKTAKPLDLS